MSDGCGRKLEKGQWWSFCGETDMGQTLPVLCKECGGDFDLVKMPVVQEITVKIDPDGTIYFLYNDKSFLKGLGKMEVTRASNVEWDVEEQKWVVWIISPEENPYECSTPYDAKGSIKRKRLIKSFEFREDAIAAEIRILNERLKNGESVSDLFKRE